MSPAATRKTGYSHGRFLLGRTKRDGSAAATNTKSPASCWKDRSNRRQTPVLPANLLEFSWSNILIYRLKVQNVIRSLHIRVMIVPTPYLADQGSRLVP